MFISSFQVLFKFSNESLVNNKNLTTTADDETTVVGGRDKSAVGSVSRARACADRFVPWSTVSPQYNPSASGVCLIVSRCSEVPLNVCFHSVWVPVCKYEGANFAWHILTRKTRFRQNAPLLCVWSKTQRFRLSRIDWSNYSLIIYYKQWCIQDLIWWGAAFGVRVWGVWNTFAF